MELLAWSLIPGLLISISVTWWPASWEYFPGAIFGAAVAVYFLKARRGGWRFIPGDALRFLCFVGLSCLAYSVALFEAEWVLGTNGFATFSSYAATGALPALFVACFVGGCIGSFVLGIGARVLLFKFDIVRGLFLCSLFSGGIGSIVAAGFEMFGFYPQFIFPVWDTGIMIVLWYLSWSAGKRTVLEPLPAR